MLCLTRYSDSNWSKFFDGTAVLSGGAITVVGSVITLHLTNKDSRERMYKQHVQTTPIRISTDEWTPISRVYTANNNT